jgi:hypothetical protein
MPLTRAPRKILTGWVDNPQPLRCPQMNWGRALKKALQSYDLPTEFVKWREMAADQNQWHAICGSKMPSTSEWHRPPHDKTSWLSFDTALFLHEYTLLHENSRWANKRNKKREKSTYSQTSRLENPEKLQLLHNHERNPVFDCAVALSTLQNALLAITRNKLTWLWSSKN